MSRIFWATFKQKSPLIEPGVLARTIIYGSNCFGMVYYCFHSLLNDYYKDFTELREKNGGPIQPSVELKGLLEIVSKDLKDMMSENTPIQLYMTPDLKPNHVGTVGTIGGGMVGLPIFYDFSKKEDIESKITVKGKNIDDIMMDEEELQLLYDSFILSEKSKKYGIVREVLLINTYKVYIEALTPLVVSYMWYIFTREIGNQIGVPRNPLYLRFAYYTIATVSGLLLWRFLYRHLLHFYEAEIEEQVAGLGPEYQEGGIEYCSKALQRKLYDIGVKNQNPSVLKYFYDYICNVLLPPGVSLQKRMAYLKYCLDESNRKIE